MQLTCGASHLHCSNGAAKKNIYFIKATMYVWTMDGVSVEAMFPSHCHAVLYKVK